MSDVTPLHVRGVVLPDDEVRDLWLVGDRVTFDAGRRGATTIADRGFVLPGLVDAHCHIGIAPGGGADRPHWTRPGAGRRRPGRRGAGDPGRRLAVPVPRAGRRPGRAATGPRRPARRAAPKRYLRDIGVEVTRRTSAGRGGRAGPGRQRLGEAGRRLDRPVASATWRRPGTPPTLAAAVARRTRPGPGSRRTRSPRRRVGGAGAGRRRLGRARHRPVRRPDIDEMARRGTALVPTMINIDTFGDIAAQAEGKFPGYAAHMRALRDRLPGGGARRRTRRACRSTSAPTRAAASRTAWPPRRCCCCTRRPACRRSTCCARGVLGGPGVAGLPRPGRGRPGRPGRLRGRPARRPAGGPGAAPHRAARPRRPLTGSPAVRRWPPAVRRRTRDAAVGGTRSWIGRQPARTVRGAPVPVDGRRGDGYEGRHGRGARALLAAGCDGRTRPGRHRRWRIGVGSERDGASRASG